MIAGAVSPNVIKKPSINPNGYAMLYHTKVTNLAHAKDTRHSVLQIPLMGLQHTMKLPVPQIFSTTPLQSNVKSGCSRQKNGLSQMR